MIRVYDPKSENFTEMFYQISKSKRPAGVYPLRKFHKIRGGCTYFHASLAVNIWIELLVRLWSYGGFKLRVRVSPQIFSAS